MELLRRAAPSLPIHGSTQMSITSREGARFAGALGVSRVVVGRELSIQEIARVAAPAPAGQEVEVPEVSRRALSCFDLLCVMVRDWQKGWTGMQG